jgi:hypothetical protein
MKYHEKKVRTVTIQIILIIMMLPSVLSILDSNASNNNMSIIVNVTQTREHPLLFLSIGYNDSDVLNEDDFLTSVWRHSEYIDYLFPLSESSGVSYISKPFFIGEDCFIGFPSKGEARYQCTKDIINRKLSIEGNFNYTLGSIIGLASDVFFSELGVYYDGKYEGIPSPHLIRVYDPILNNDKYHKSTSAHELGHQFGLCDELYGADDFRIQDNASDCPN